MSASGEAPPPEDFRDTIEQRVTPLELFFDLVFVFAITQVTGILSAMAAMLVASLAVPGAFGEDGVLFGLVYFAVRLLHVALYALATRNEPEMSRAVVRLAPGFLGGPALLIVAGFLDGPAQGVLWVLALAIDYGAPLARGVLGFRVHARHFV